MLNDLIYFLDEHSTHNLSLMPFQQRHDFIEEAQGVSPLIPALVSDFLT